MMNSCKALLVTLTVTLMLTFSQKTRAGDVNSIQITSTTMNGAISCLNWELRGVCVWLKISLFSVSVKTSLKVANHVPELTFQTYDSDATMPWTEAKSILSITGSDSDGFFTRGLTSLMGATGAYRNTGGGTNGSSKSASRSKTKFKMVDALGHPAASVWESTLGNSDLMCSPTTTMFQPYYVSNLDLFNWRQNFGVEF